MLVGREINRQNKKTLINEVKLEIKNNFENVLKNNTTLQKNKSNIVQQPTTELIIEKSILNAINKRAIKIFNVFYIFYF